MENCYLQELSSFIFNEYNIRVRQLTPAKRGYFGETWKLDSFDRKYFIKLDYTYHKEIYKNSFHIIQYLCDKGIDFISKIVKTKSGLLYSYFNSGILGIYEWIDGENIQNEKTKAQEYKMLSEVYKIPVTDLTIEKEDFSADCISVFNNLREELKKCESSSAKQIVSILDGKSSILSFREKRLHLFADRCKYDNSHFYITHGDAGGNIILNGKTCYLIDWDSPLLAPPERDAWFCIHWEWAIKAFEKCLSDNEIVYKLNPNRMAYYCYYSFFYYLTEYLKSYLYNHKNKDDMPKLLSEFFDCWIEENLNYADTIK